jgi:dTDP-glucose 4,6-dehydratase
VTWAAQRVVITGGAGFLGSHLCRRFLESDHDVVCVDNLVTGRASNIHDLYHHDPRFTFLYQNVSDVLDVSGPVDAVLHFASPASPVAYQAHPIATLRVGAEGTYNALQLARLKGARFLLASTSEVYGDPLIHPQPETYWGNVNPIGPRSMYDEAKRYAEALTVACRDAKYGVDTRIARIFNTYGPNMRSDDGRAVPTFIRQAMARESLTVQGSGQQTRALCYVDDLVEGIVRLLHSDYDGPVNLGNPGEISMLELAEMVYEIVGNDYEPHILPVERAGDDPEMRDPDISLAEFVLNWTPQVTLRDGLTRTVNWFQK